MSLTGRDTWVNTIYYSNEGNSFRKKVFGIETTKRKSTLHTGCFGFSLRKVERLRKPNLIRAKEKKSYLR